MFGLEALKTELRGGETIENDWNTTFLSVWLVAIIRCDAFYTALDLR